MSSLIDSVMMIQKNKLPFPLFFNYCSLMLLTQIAAGGGSLNGCPDKCGNIDVPYPFGFTPGCFREDFELICNETYSPPKLFNSDNYEITSNISLQSAELTVLLDVTRSCYDASGFAGLQSNIASLNPFRPFRFSQRNRFTTLGCQAHAYVAGQPGTEIPIVSSCVSTCYTGVVFDGSGACAGIGCCQSSYGQGVWYYEPLLSSFSLNDSVLEGAGIGLSRCIYAFLVIDGEYRFKESDLNRTDYFKTPVALSWAIRNYENMNETCDEAMRNKTAYACQSPMSECIGIRGEGYRCNCSDGYEGNPYLPDGCKDIDECSLPNRCFGDCANINGSFVCECPKGKEGDATTINGCSSKDHFTPALKAVTGAGIGVFFVVGISLLVYLGFQRRKLIKTKQKFFKKNGGFLVQQQIHSGGQSTAFKIFSKEELEKATRNFDDGRVLGRGGHGTVYKGVLDGGTVVAIKKSKLMDTSETKEFSKELSILSQLNHKNIVKLLGCCLEVEVPMLVYEYVSNGTLFHLIHGSPHHSPIPFDLRLKIAVEAAEALAYLHSAASPPILHGDVKSANILLAGDFSAKVSDFGASRLAPGDEVQFATLVQGTCGYLDPEYLITSQLTDKSDVYSFGVVLLELLTGRKAFSFEGPEEGRCLALSFLTAMEENRLLEITDGHIVDGGGEREAMIRDMAEVASQCLRRVREERPTMKEVAESLEMVWRYKKYSWIRHNSEDTRSLLDKH